MHDADAEHEHHQPLLVAEDDGVCQPLEGVLGGLDHGVAMPPRDTDSLLGVTTDCRLPPVAWVRLTRAAPAPQPPAGEVNTRLSTKSISNWWYAELM